MFSRKQNFIRQEKIVDRAKSFSVWQILLIPLRLLPYLVLLILFFALLIGVFAGVSLAPYYSALKLTYQAADAGSNHLMAAEKFINRNTQEEKQKAN